MAPRLFITGLCQNAMGKQNVGTHHDQVTWKLLYYSGREILMEEVLSAIPTYFLTVFKLPHGHSYGEVTTLESLVATGLLNGNSAFDQTNGEG
jgi:hypothetical protein